LSKFAAEAAPTYNQILRVLCASAVNNICKVSPVTA
jgi:hypothetical protein